MTAPPPIRDDLRGLFRGPLHLDDAARALYATDASSFRLTPLAVALPLDAEDLVTLVKYAHENRLPLVPRGAGTGLAGGCLGGGLVVDLSAHLRGSITVGPDWVHALAGETVADVGRELARHGRRLGPDVARAETRTVGGLVATDACGPNVFRHGYTRDAVRALGVVWDDGERGSVTAPGFAATPAVERGRRLVELRGHTPAILAEHRELIQLTRPQTPFTRCGYRLHDALTAAGLDLTRLLCGSEGTLGVFTDVTLRTVPLAGGTARALLGFAGVDVAIQAGLALLPRSGAVACELLDQRQLALGKAAGPATIPVPPAIAAVLSVTFEGETPAEALALLTASLDALRRDHRFATLAEPTADPAACQRLAAFALAPALGVNALGAGPRPAPGCEDVAVPVEELAKFVAGVRGLAQRHELAVPLRVDVLAGQVQAMPLLDLRLADDRQKLWSFADAVHTTALALGGTIGTRHGTGLLRSPWVERQFGPLVKVFQAVKQLYDPRNILNPGKLTDPDPSRPAWPFAPLAGSSESGRVALPLAPWAGEVFRSREALAREVEACNNCGDCRSHVGRMCPVFHATHADAASPRAKANLWRAALDDPDAFARLRRDDAEAVARLCVNCKMCKVECPSRVDVPRLMLEAKAAHYAENGFTRGQWVAARVEGLSMLAGAFAFTANALLGLRPTRWLGEKLFGVSRLRALPRFTHRTFMRRAWRLGLTGKRPPIRGNESVPPAGDAGPGEKVVYFVDLFANFHDPTLGLAAVAVLRHQGISVFVPWRQRGSGMAALVQGDIETAREFARWNVRTLAPLVREGYRVVCSDPTAALALTQDYLDLVDGPDARLVAENTIELTSFLWRLHELGRLRTDFEPLALQLGHHVPCHVKALGAGAPAGPKLLGLIPALTVKTVDVSCSGMAGTYGLRAENFAASLAAGRPMLDVMRGDAVAYGSTECGACRMQIQTAAGKRTLHPVQYLALAYGLMPELRTKLARPLGRLVTDG